MPIASAQNKLRPPGSSGHQFAEVLPNKAKPFQPSNHRVRLPVAVDGFCVVALRDHQQWVAGKEKYQTIFDGQLYWFSGERQRAMFAAAPERYVPALGGDCVVTYADTGRRPAGRPEYGLLHQQRLYFFAGPDQLERFRANPDRYATVDWANQGYCVVSERDDQRKILGQPSTVAIVGGLRYFFAGAHQRNLFLANRQRYGVGLPEQGSGQRPSEALANTPRPLGSGNSAAPTLSDQGSAFDEKEHPDPSGSTTKEKPLPDAAERTVSVGGAPGHVQPAMEGYSPVSILEQGQWVHGRYKFHVEHDGKVYLLTGEEEKTLFLQDPNRYLPALEGDCAVSLVDSNKHVAGSIYYAAQYQGRLFLFAGADQKQAFKSSPETYAQADLALEGNCVVTHVDEGKLVKGKAELMVWHHGMRYYFATPELREKFLANPEHYTQPLMQSE